MTKQCFACALLMFASLAFCDERRLVVHEWGTFTTLQDESGKELMGINIDDEPVPAFVHNLEPLLLDSPVLQTPSWSFRQKGAPRFHPQVSMRLETPVIYFYPPAGAKLPLTLDVNVKFHGGWLTEFFPNAKVLAPTKTNKPFDFRELNAKTCGELNWRNVQVGTKGEGPQTEEQVWLAPRKTAAAMLTSEEGESERFLFYRGVAQRSAPLKVTTSKTGEHIEVAYNRPADSAAKDESIAVMWLMETRADGKTAFRSLHDVKSDAWPKKMDRRFALCEFHESIRKELEDEMHAALVADGLFADEATALLSTWQRAYFTSPGLRLFFIVPRSWTDEVLPLTISGDPKIERVMIGRIELISDAQRNALKKLVATEEYDARWVEKVYASPELGRFLAGRSDLKELGVEMPEHFQVYMSLGRFRNALVAHEAKKPDSKHLHLFINNYSLNFY